MPHTLVITLALFFLSGASGLIYQVVWVRQALLLTKSRFEEQRGA